ncbi:fibronectin type III domain-containing protein [Flavobacterium sp. H4147]|uniref:fibronectin type III domain-containing protein n=1 Tax=Flavobacterium sp. H4147 TaxID=3034149 RepID=UPI0023ECF3F1|nr:fibronectin type III domain-containing protein [Flavobacterium sp. H4147]
MKQVNFSHSGGFPLEQETLERLQTAYRSELYEAIKAHFSIELDKNYIITHATAGTKGWVIINRDENNLQLPGILYPIAEGLNTGYLKTTRIGTNLVYGTGVSQTAYFDYEAKYISSSDYSNRPTNSQNNDALTVNYYNLQSFKTIKDIKSIEANIDLINQSYLPLNGSKAMQGDLNLGIYQLSKLDTKENSIANVRSAEFKLGSVNKRGLRHSGDYLGRALVDNSTSSETNLSLNYNADWDNTYIGGKVYLNNLNTTSSNGTLLVLDNQNQINKNNTLINSLINRITDLENRPASTVPIGMIALWGKPAPFPEGWEEYIPLRGRMPVGLDSGDSVFNTLLNYGGDKNKTLTVNEMPPHSHKFSSDNYEHASGMRFGGNESYQTGIAERDTESTGLGQSFSILNPYRVVHFIEYTGNQTDTTPPTSPNNLTVSNIGTTSLTLNWTAATDNVGVTNYLVYKDNSNIPLIELGKDILTYNVTGLASNTTYSFQVKAKDARGNLSTPATTNATTNASPANLTVPTLQHAYYGGENMILQWPNYIDEGPITYELYRSINGGGSMLLKTSTDTFYYDNLSNGVTYSYQIRINSNGYISPYSNTVTVTGTSS